MWEEKYMQIQFQESLYQCLGRQISMILLERCETLFVDVRLRHRPIFILFKGTVLLSFPRIYPATRVARPINVRVKVRFVWQGIEPSTFRFSPHGCSDRLAIETILIRTNNNNWLLMSKLIVF
jgi:hypothetical protein